MDVKYRYGLITIIIITVCWKHSMSYHSSFVYIQMLYRNGHNIEQKLDLVIQVIKNSYYWQHDNLYVNQFNHKNIPFDLQCGTNGYQSS